MWPKRSASFAGLSTSSVSWTVYSNVIGDSTFHDVAPDGAVLASSLESEMSTLAKSTESKSLVAEERHASSCRNSRLFGLSRAGTERGLLMEMSKLSGKAAGARTARGTAVRTEIGCAPAWTATDGIRYGHAYVNVVRCGASSITVFMSVGTGETPILCGFRRRALG